MKNKKLRVLASLFFIGAASIGLASCSDDKKETVKTETTVETGTKVESNTNKTETTNKQQEVTVSSISVTGGKRDFEIGESFVSTGLVVTATKSDNTTEVVTDFTVDSKNVDLTKAGQYNVVVTYKGVTTTYKVTVKEPVVVSEIVLLTENCKKVFEVGSQFTHQGLEVVAQMSDGSEQIVTDFTVKVYSDEALTQEVTELSAVGTYYVKVSSLDKFAKYEITVETAKYVVVNEFTANNLSGELKTNGQELFAKDGAKVSVVTKTGASKFIVAESNNIEYNKDGISKSFTTRFNFKGVGDTSDLAFKIELEKDEDIAIYARSGSKDHERYLMLTNGADFSEQIKVSDALSRTVFTLKAGTYYLHGLKVEGANNGGNFIYGLDFAYKVEKSSLTYSQLEVDSSLVKKDYNLGEELDTTGLVAKALNNYGIKDIVTDITVDPVDLTTPGIKTVTVKFGQLETSYEIQVIALDAKTQTLEIVEAAKNLVFKKGQVFDASGLKIEGTDQYNVKSLINKDTEGVSIKVLNNETDVTETFGQLEKGNYKVQITYDDVTVTYDITIIDIVNHRFEYNTTVAVGSTSIASKLVLVYGDGTETDYSKFDDVVLSTTDGYSQTFYSDELCQTEATLQTLTASEGTFYAKFKYQSYLSDAIAITVKNISSDSFAVSQLTEASGTDLKGKTIYDGSLMTIKVGSASCKLDVSDSIANGEKQIKLDSSTDASKSIIITAKQDVTLTLIINASGNKNYIIKNSNGSANVTGSVSKSATDTQVEITVKAGETITLYTTGGGVRFAGCQATKA